MSTMFKKFSAIGLSITTAVWLSGAVMLVPSANAALTESQIQAIVSLLSSFGADATTISNVDASLRGQATSGTGTGSAASTTFTRDLTMGSRGTDVKALQQFLNNNGYTVASSGVGSSGNETEYFGSLTKAAVMKYQTAKGISPVAGYFGPLTRLSVNTTTGTGTGTGSDTTGVVVPATGIAVSVSSATPAGDVLPKGAFGVEMLKFNLAGSGTVTNVVVRRIGAGQTADFSNVYLYRGSERLTSGRTVNSSSHKTNFTGLNLSISGVTTLRIVADIATTATANDQNAFQVTSVTSGATITGLPVSGSNFSISGASSGTVTAQDQSDGLSDPAAGQSNAEVFRFKLTTANEDMNLERISVFYAGAVSKSNLSNFTLKDLLTGNTVATAASVNAEDLIVFNFSTPYELLKGDSRQFQMYTDISGDARSGTAETLVFYFEANADIYAVGQQYGYGAATTITDIDTTADYRTDDSLSLQSGNFIISHLGPNTGDIAKNGKDLNLFEFTIQSANNVEVRNIRFTVAASTSQVGVDDFKIVDVDSGVIVSGPTDDATGSVVMTDDFNIPAGTTKRYKVTGDTDTNWANNDDIQVTLAAFTANDLKNTDNNTFLTVLSDVVPSTAIAGNTLTVAAPTLTVNLSPLPGSNSFVKGTNDVPFLGLNLQATADDIKLTSIKISASDASTTTAGDVATYLQSVALYDGVTGSRISDVKAWTSGTPRTITFSNMTYVITKGQTKNVVVKGNISSAMGGEVEEWAVYLAAVTTEITAIDTDGNTPAFGGVTTVNTGQSGTNDRVITVLQGGTITVATAADDTESKAGVVVAGTSKTVLGKFDFTATNETMTVNKLKLKVNNVSASATDVTGVLDNIVALYLYDGGTALANGVAFVPSGADGIITIQDLGWEIPKDTTRKLTVKADLNTIAAGADSGDELRVHVIEPNFEATGSATIVISLTSAPQVSKEKVVYKGYPSLATVTLGSSALTSLTDIEVARFRINANSNDIDWAQIGLQFTLSNASASDVTLTLTNVTLGSSVTVGTQVPTTTALDITGGTATNALLQIDTAATAQQISAGGYYEYSVKLSATGGQFGTANETETLSTKIVLLNDSAAASLANGVAARTVIGYTDAAIGSDNAFVWSDRSATSHTLLTTDWANGVYVVEPDLLSSWVLTR